MASTLLSPMVDYYNDEEELDSVDEDDERSFRGRDSEEGTVTDGRAAAKCWKTTDCAPVLHSFSKLHCSL